MYVHACMCMCLGVHTCMYACMYAAKTGQELARTPARIELMAGRLVLAMLASEIATTQLSNQCQPSRKKEKNQCASSVMASSMVNRAVKTKSMASKMAFVVDSAGGTSNHMYTYRCMYVGERDDGNSRAHTHIHTHTRAQQTRAQNTRTISALTSEMMKLSIMQTPKKD